MSEDEALRKLEEWKKGLDKQYAELKGIIKGVRLTGLDETDEKLLGLSEFIVDAYKILRDEITDGAKRQIRTNQKISSLEEKIKGLEKDILRLRQTLDRMAHDK